MLNYNICIIRIIRCVPIPYIIVKKYTHESVRFVHFIVFVHIIIYLAVHIIMYEYYTYVYGL